MKKTGLSPVFYNQKNVRCSLVQPDFIIIPTVLYNDSTLRPADQRLYGYILWLTRLKKNGHCTASNETLAELTGTDSIGQIKNSLKRLEAGGWIQRVFTPTGRMTRTEIVVKRGSPYGDGRVTIQLPSTAQRGSPYGDQNKSIITKTLNKSISPQNRDIHPKGSIGLVNEEGLDRLRNLKAQRKFGPKSMD